MVTSKIGIKGFQKGLNNVGIIDLGLNNSTLMKMDLDQLVYITQKEKITEMGIWQWVEFLFWSFISQIIFLFPLMLGIVAIIYLIGN